MAISIVVVDGRTLVRQGVRAVLEGEPDLEFAGEAENAVEALQMAREWLPDVVLMGMSDREDALEGIRRIVLDNPCTRLLAFSLDNDGSWVMAALKAGAAGCLLTDCNTDDLRKAIRGVAGEPSCSGHEERHVVYGRFCDSIEAPLARLTKRELAVLRGIVNGHNTREIAGAAGVSIKTVECQRTSIFKKLQLSSVAELTKFAIRAGLTSV